jgi:hypothetical protein
MEDDYHQKALDILDNANCKVNRFRYMKWDYRQIIYEFIWRGETITDTVYEIIAYGIDYEAMLFQYEDECAIFG